MNCFNFVDCIQTLQNYFLFPPKNTEFLWKNKNQGLMRRNWISSLSSCWPSRLVAWWAHCQLIICGQRNELPESFCCIDLLPIFLVKKNYFRIKFWKSTHSCGVNHIYNKIDRESGLQIISRGKQILKFIRGSYHANKLCTLIQTGK